MTQQCRLLPLPVSRPAGAQQRRRGHLLTCLSPLTCWRVLTDGKWFRGETLIRLLSNSDWWIQHFSCESNVSPDRRPGSSADLRFLCSFHVIFCSTTSQIYPKHMKSLSSVSWAAVKGSLWVCRRRQSEEKHQSELHLNTNILLNTPGDWTGTRCV